MVLTAFDREVAGLHPEVSSQQPQQLTVRLAVHGRSGNTNPQHAVHLAHDLAPAGAGNDADLDGADLGAQRSAAIGRNATNAAIAAGRIASRVMGAVNSKPNFRG